MMQPSAEQPNEVPRVDIVQDTGGNSQVKVSGIWNPRPLEPFLPGIEGTLSEYARHTPEWDLSGIAALDHAGALLLWRSWGRRKIQPLNMRPEHAVLFSQLDLPTGPL